MTPPISSAMGAVMFIEMLVKIDLGAICQSLIFMTRQTVYAMIHYYQNVQTTVRHAP